MNEVNLLQELGQVSASQVGEVFRDFMRGHVREMISEVMAAEVTELCGPKHAPSPGDHYRAGSSPGRVLVEGNREEVIRLRVRCKSDQGASREVELANYRAANDPAQLKQQVIQAIIAGVSSRSIQELKPDSPGCGSLERLAVMARGRQQVCRPTARQRFVWHLYAECTQLACAPSHFLRLVENFFSNYKQLEGVTIEPLGWSDLDNALIELQNSIARFKAASEEEVTGQTDFE